MKVERQSILASSLQTQSCKELRECFMVQNERRLLVEVAGVAVEVVEVEAVEVGGVVVEGEFTLLVTLSLI